MKCSRITVFGDVSITGRYEAKISDNAWKKTLAGLNSLLDGGTFSLANLESPLTYMDNSIAKIGPCLRSSPELARDLRAAGFDCFGLANNHILDFGEKGICETIETLSENNLSFFGIAHPKIESANHISVELAGVTVTFLAVAEREFNFDSALGVGALLYDDETTLTAISKYKSQGHFIVILYSGGLEHYPYPPPFLFERCRSMVEAGAAIVLCQHSHCVGAIDFYRDSLICYGQGNSVFGYSPTRPSWNTGLVFEILPPRTMTRFRVGELSVNLHVIQTSREGILSSASPEKTLTVIENAVRMGQETCDTSILKQRYEEYLTCAAKMMIPVSLGFGKTLSRLDRLLGQAISRAFFDKHKAMLLLNLARNDSHRDVLIRCLERELDRLER